MTNLHGPNSTSSLGFVTVTRDSDQTLYGGFLILSPVGRPLEFHCTAPVRPSRAQEILYGPALEPYLYGERIAQTLIAAARKPPSFVMTDQSPAMAARPLITCPLILLGDVAEDPAETDAAANRSGVPRFHRVDPPHSRSIPNWVRLEPFQMQQYTLAVSAEHASDRQLFMRLWPQFGEQLELHEPFARIREAIEEARGAGGG